MLVDLVPQPRIGGHLGFELHQFLAGKLAIADLQLTNRDEVLELERAGCDAVIVHGAEVSSLVGGPPPEV